MSYKAVIQGEEACVVILKTGEQDSFFALVVFESGESAYAIGQLDETIGYYHMSFVLDRFVYDILIGELDWMSDVVWVSGRYTYADQQAGYMQKIDLSDDVE